MLKKSNSNKRTVRVAHSIHVDKRVRGWVAGKTV